MNALRRTALCILALAAAATTLPAAAEALDDILKAKVIRIAVPQDFPPFGTVGTDMQPLGYDIDMAQLIGKELGVKVEIVPVTSANRIPYLQTKKVDLVISAWARTPSARRSSISPTPTRHSSRACSDSRTSRSPSPRTSPARRSA